MTTKLQRIQQQVAAHMAAKETSNRLIAKMEQVGWLEEHEYKQVVFNPKLDAAMQLLAAVLPLLEAAVEWDKMDSDIEFDESVMICDALSDKVQKLLEEVEE